MVSVVSTWHWAGDTACAARLEAGEWIHNAETHTNQGSHSETLCEFGQHKESRFIL